MSKCCLFTFTKSSKYFLTGLKYFWQCCCLTAFPGHILDIVTHPDLSNQLVNGKSDCTIFAAAKMRLWRLRLVRNKPISEMSPIVQCCNVPYLSNPPGLFLTNLNRHSLILAAFWPRQRWCNQIFDSPLGCWDMGVWQYQESGLGRLLGNNIAKNISSQLKNSLTIL